jgi:ubiquinone/menaquinone biosynthesis C-methylase UbiE
MSGLNTTLERLTALGEAVRLRILLVLQGRELTVGELCAVLQLPQSTVSRHLRLLMDEAWVDSRQEGSSRRYRMTPERAGPAARALWALVAAEAAGSSEAAQDRSRLEAVLASRRTAAQAFFTESAGEWDRLRAEMFGSRPEIPALLGLLDDGWTVGDLGCGTGSVAEALSPFVRRVVAVDDSAEMLSAAEQRLRGRENVELRRGDVTALPLGDGVLDAALLVLITHYLPDPSVALREVARVLRPGGRLLLVDMTPHNREEYRVTMGHLWLGFSPEEMEGWAREAGLERPRYTPLLPDTAAKGPALFAFTARAPDGARLSQHTDQESPR